jgi:hypothetical protein
MTTSPSANALVVVLDFMYGTSKAFLKRNIAPSTPVVNSVTA